MNFAAAVKKYAGQPLTRQVLLSLLEEYKRPFDKLDELVKQQQLVQVRRGLYIPGRALDLPGPEPFLLANHLYGPSYVSMEAALSYWGMIPEMVVEITSVTTGPSRKYNTPAGRFSYRHVNTPYYSFGIQQLKMTDKQVVLLAGKEKALCDKLVTTAGLQLRSVAQTRSLLIDDLRMDKQVLKTLDRRILASWLNSVPKKKTIEILIKTLEAL